MPFNSLRPLLQAGLGRLSYGRFTSPTRKGGYCSGSSANTNTQSIFHRTTCRCLNCYNLIRRHAHADAKLCYHQRLPRPRPPLRLSHLRDIIRRCQVRQVTSKIFGGTTAKCLHTSSFSASSNETLTPIPKDKDPSLAYKKSGKTYLAGPDQLIPSDAIYTWHADGAVRLGQLCRGKGQDRPAISIPSMFLEAVETSPNVPAIADKRNGKWKKWTYEQYYEDSRKAAKAFIALGLQRLHSVCILGFNSPEWFISDLGAIMAGGIPAGIYTTNSPEACAYVAEDSKANIFIVEDELQLAKILPYRKKLPHLKALIQYRGKPSAEGVLSWDDVMKLGEEQTDEGLNERLTQICVNQCSTLIYTSGTTGKPKGVMLSHDNITWISNEAKDFFLYNDTGVEDLVSYLPLSHIAAQTADMYFPMAIQGTTYFADPDALKGSLIHTLKEIQPTKFLAVPRVWEKMYETLKEIGSQSTGLKLKLATWAKEQGTLYNKKRIAGDPNPSTLEFQLADKLILSQIRKALGLSRADLKMSAAAPISNEILEYFMSLNIVITEAYGLSESSGPHSIGIEQKNLVRFGSIGVQLDGVDTRLDKQTPDGQGEICMGGRHLFMGYLNKEETTRNAIDEQGWFHTEDLGRFDEDGFLFITGRLKELIITAGGENVAPVPIEDNIKQALPCLSNAMVIGDKRKFLSVLITFRTEMDKDTNEPLDNLTPAAKKWVESHGDCSVVTVRDVMVQVYKKNNTKLINAISAAMNLANSKAVSRAQRFQKWVILPVDFSIPGGELGPTMKLKRKVVEEKYADLIHQVYKDGFDPNCTGALG